MKTYISIGFCTILLGITFATFAAEEQMHHRESWQLQAEAVLQATHSKLGAQAALLATVGPAVIQKIAHLLKPTGFIINNTNQSIVRMYVAHEKKSLIIMDDYYDYKDALASGNVQKVIKGENSLDAFTKGSFHDRIDRKFLAKPIFVCVCLKKIKSSYYHTDPWTIDNVILHNTSNIYVEKRGGKIVLTISTPNEPLAFYQSNEGYSH